MGIDLAQGLGLARSDVVAAQRRDRALVALRWFLVAVVAASMYQGWRLLVVTQSHWRLSDWMITYDAGFVRRGLGGEFVAAAAKFGGVPVPVAALAVTMTGYLTFMAAGYVLVRRLRPVPWPLWPLLFSPWLFAFQVHDPRGAFVKDSLALAVVAGAAGACALRQDRAADAVAVGAVLFVPLVLMHEMMLVFVPYLLVLGCDAAWRRRQMFVAVAGILGAGAALLAAVAWSGTREQVAALCHRAAAITATTAGACEADGAVAWLGFSAGAAIENTAQAAPAMAPHVLAVVVLLGAGLWPAVRMLPAWRRRWLAGAAIMSGLASVPLFVVAVDWGRFVYLHAACIALVTLAWLRPASGDRPGRPRWWLPWLVGYATAWHVAHYGALFRLGVFG